VPQLMETPQPGAVVGKSESSSPVDFNLNFTFVLTDKIPPLELSPPKTEKVRTFTT